MAATLGECCYFELRDLMWSEPKWTDVGLRSVTVRPGPATHSTFRHGFQNKTGYRPYPGLFSTNCHIYLKLL